MKKEEEKGKLIKIIEDLTEQDNREIYQRKKMYLQLSRQKTERKKQTTNFIPQQEKKEKNRNDA